MQIPTGTRGLDELLDGGIPANRLYVVSGPPGSGKTTFGAQFVSEGAAREERSMYVSMHESPQELIEDMSSFGFGFESAANSEWLSFLDLTDDRSQQRLTEFAADSEMNAIATMIQELGLQRVVIDSTMLLDYFLSEPADALVEFVTTLKRVDATVVLISEMTDPDEWPREHFLAHGVIVLDNFHRSQGMTRGLQVVKMRGMPIETEMHSVSFTPSGLAVNPEETVAV